MNVVLTVVLYLYDSGFYIRVSINVFIFPVYSLSFVLDLDQRHVICGDVSKLFS